MATYTVTTGTAGAPVDYAALGTRVSGDIYNINGGYLLVDTDTRYGLGGAAAAGFGAITLSATLGGSIEFNSTKVRLIPFTAGSGTVPAANTTISQGSASGKLLGVYAALNAAPLAAAVAMPATGWIKIRAWNSISYTVSALTGISATGSADRAGWIEIVGVDTGACTVNRLNLFKARGDYYTFDGVTTTGSNTGTYQLPTNGSGAVYLPGVEVETGVGTGIYDFYPSAGGGAALAASVATDAVRGKWCWIAPTTGLVRFGADGTNSTGGYVPPAGCKIRVYNQFYMCCAAAASVNSVPHTTVATRYDFTTTGGGVIDIDTVSMNWYLSLNQPYSVALNNVSFADQLVLTECASPITWNTVSGGQTAGSGLAPSLTMNFNFAGGTLTNCTWTRPTLGTAGAGCIVASDCSNFTFTKNRAISFARFSNALSSAFILTRFTNTIIDICTVSAPVQLISCASISINNLTYYDNPATTTGTGTPVCAVLLGTSCTKIVVDGMNFGGLKLVQPYAGILNIIGQSCYDIKLRNIGSFASPLDMGNALFTATWTQATTTATATTPTPHLLKVNDIVYVVNSSNTGIITTAAKTVLSVPTSTTFTFTCLTGSVTGTIAFYQQVTSSLLVIASSMAANTVKVQRCYATHLRAAVITGDNSSKNIVLESVFGDPYQVFSENMLNCSLKMVVGTHSLSAQTSVYGSHFFDGYTTGTPANTGGISWSRTTSTATVTSAGHGLKTNDIIAVTVSSDIAAIVLGIKTITCPTPDTYTFTCLNAGAASGTLTNVIANGRIGLMMNEPTSDTVSQVTLTNGATFTSAGGLYMPVIGQTATFETPYYLLGHNSFINSALVMAGGTATNYSFEYSIDKNDGNGFSTMTTSSYTATTLATALNGLTAINAALGFKLKLKVSTTTTNATAITSVYLLTNSTSANRAIQYPLDTITLTLTGLVSGSDIVILAAGTSTILAQVDSLGATSYNHIYETAQAVDIGIIKPGYVPLYIRNYSLSSSNASLPISQVADRNYS